MTVRSDASPLKMFHLKCNNSLKRGFIRKFTTVICCHFEQVDYGKLNIYIFFLLCGKVNEVLNNQLKNSYKSVLF